MSSNLQLPVALPIDEATLEIIREDAVDWAHAHGLIMRTSERKSNGDICQSAPFALFPSPFPADVFKQAEEVQKAMNLLYFRISYDYEFLKYWHSEVVKTDDFTKGLLDILEKVMQNGGPRQKKMLLTQRSDYMCHVGPEGERELKQIELNRIYFSKFKKVFGLTFRNSVLSGMRILSSLLYVRFLIGFHRKIPILAWLKTRVLILAKSCILDRNRSQQHRREHGNPQRALHKTPPPRPQEPRLHPHLIPSPR
ncbi:hypothetical protein L596_028793 [Steinernema carpocapsae]|uniref:Uncharacterized protein n=1 Tax=Steinernema carpocapsae TaxID=34508 RepID=A0A4U5M0F6_STECR|nr:hypothetical protein L596_028793 [Steinernema carpocapsae]